MIDLDDGTRSKARGGPRLGGGGLVARHGALLGRSWGCQDKPGCKLTTWSHHEVRMDVLKSTVMLATYIMYAGQLFETPVPFVYALVCTCMQRSFSGASFADPMHLESSDTMRGP